MREMNYVGAAPGKGSAKTGNGTHGRPPCQSRPIRHNCSDLDHAQPRIADSNRIDPAWVLAAGRISARLKQRATLADKPAGDRRAGGEGRDHGRAADEKRGLVQIGSDGSLRSRGGCFAKRR